jgi:hypothetical protein
VKFITQRYYVGGWGDCVQSSLASILGLDWHAVPDFSPNTCNLAGKWQGYLVQGWLKSEHGIEMFDMWPWEASHGLAPGIDVRGLNIVLAESPRIRPGLHAVVAWNGELIWDPHPKRHMGVGQIREWWILRKNGEPIE